MPTYELFRTIIIKEVILVKAKDKLEAMEMAQDDIDCTILQENEDVEVDYNSIIERT